MKDIFTTVVSLLGLPVFAVAFLFGVVWRFTLAGLRAADAFCDWLHEDWRTWRMKIDTKS